MPSSEILNEMYSCLNDGDIDAANSYALKLLKSNSESAPAWFVVGEHQLKEANFKAAETSFRCVTTIAPDFSSGWARLRDCMFRLGNFENALQACLNAISLDPSIENFASYFRLPDQAKTTVAREKVTQILIECLARNSRSAEYYLLLCRLYMETQELEKASSAYLMAVGCDPQNPKLQRDYGLFLFEIGFSEKSASVLLELTQKEPSEPLNWQILGGCYFRAGNYAKAIEANLEVLSLQSENEGARLNLSMAYASLGLYKEAAKHIQPLIDSADFSGTTVSMQYLGVCTKNLYFRRYLGEMGSFSKEQMCALEEIGKINKLLVIPITPFLLLPLIDSPEIQLRVCQSVMNNDLLKRRSLTHTDKVDGKIRIGWFGSDFYDHATMYLLKGVFRLYDRAKFEFRVYDYGGRRDEVTEELESFVDGYFDLKGFEDKDIIELSRSHELDIAVDLKGFTGGGKTEMFAAGLAPLHVFYLGYPGTSGKDFMDYMIADRVTIPEEFREHYSEKIVFMPNSYQPNDFERLTVLSETERADWGLDPEAIVFASFNQVYKIGQDEVRVWAKLLAEVPASQLWFYCSGQEEYRLDIEQNITEEFGKHGISSERLVFAYSVPIDEHLCRLRHADIFLDAFNVNGHTTVSDALFAGIPVVTKPGRQFAARVGASLVSASGCGELITYSEEEYFQLAFKLATDDSYRESVISKLKNVKESALYDTHKYVSDLERGFERLVANSREGRQPRDIYL